MYGLNPTDMVGKLRVKLFCLIYGSLLWKADKILLRRGSGFIAAGDYFQNVYRYVSNGSIPYVHHGVETIEW